MHMLDAVMFMDILHAEIYTYICIHMYTYTLMYGMYIYIYIDTYLCIYTYMRVRHELRQNFEKKAMKMGMGAIHKQT